MITVTWWLAFIGGFLSFVSPCVLPLVPAYIGYMSNRVTAQAIAGTDIASGLPVPNSNHRNRFQMALHGISFVIGFSLIFVVFGLALTAGTRALSATAFTVQRDIIPRAGGVLIILFGLHFLGVIVPALHWLECRPELEQLGSAGLTLRRGLRWLQSVLYSDTRPQLQQKQASGLIGSGLMGIVFAAGWTPCIGPIYGTILTMAASSSQNLVQAGALLAMYSLGLGVPFILAAVLLDRAKGLLNRLKPHLNKIKVASGLIMILIGVLIYTGNLQRISQFGAANATFSYKLESCAVQVFDGKLPVSGVKECLEQP